MLIVKQNYTSSKKRTKKWKWHFDESFDDEELMFGGKDDFKINVDFPYNYCGTINLGNGPSKMRVVCSIFFYIR